MFFELYWAKLAKDCFLPNKIAEKKFFFCREGLREKEITFSVFFPRILDERLELRFRFFRSFLLSLFQFGGKRGLWFATLKYRKSRKQNGGALLLIFFSSMICTLFSSFFFFEGFGAAASSFVSSLFCSSNNSTLKGHFVAMCTGSNNNSCIYRPLSGDGTANVVCMWYAIKGIDALILRKKRNFFYPTTKDFFQSKFNITLFCFFAVVLW